jgi:ATP-binding cassette, subfamily B, bacterial
MKEIFLSFKPYYLRIFLLIVLTFLTNGLTILIPRIVSTRIDQEAGDLLILIQKDGFQLLSICLVILALECILAYFAIQTREKYAFDLRQQIVSKLSRLKYSKAQQYSTNEIYTNFTSDVDNVKEIIINGFVSVTSSAVIFFGALAMTLSISWKMTLVSLSLIPILFVTFVFVFSRVGKLFAAVQNNLTAINRIINESIVASALVRVLNSQKTEESKFANYNDIAKGLGLKIVDNFATLIPVIFVVSNAGVLLLLYFGGLGYEAGELTVGQITAFLIYYNLLITPIFVFGIVGSTLTRSKVSLTRIKEFMELEEDDKQVDFGKTDNFDFFGRIEFRNVNLVYGTKSVLKDINFTINPNTKTAILGPVASGKSLILQLLAGLIEPTSGEVLLDGKPINQWKREWIRKYVGIVFQDSLIFNTSIRENIVFDQEVTDKDLDKAIATANLDEFLESLPNGIYTDINERGGNLSGGQKQRIMLARSLVFGPKLLLLDDFTSRVDVQTEKEILSKVKSNYPLITLLSVTQKIEPIKDYDNIILIMEGEIIGVGKHNELLSKSQDYRQIYKSQQSLDQTTELEPSILDSQYSLNQGMDLIKIKNLSKS